MTAPSSRLLSGAALGVLLIVILTIVAFLPALDNEFVQWDDPTHITQNLVIRELNGETVRIMFTQPIAKLYAPLTWLSFAIDYKFWGESAAGFHVVNLIWHAANTILVMMLVARVLTIRGMTQWLPWVPLLVGALFGIHPLRVESVAWATERKDVLFAFFYLLALLVYLRWVSGSSYRRQAVESPAEPAPHVNGYVWYFTALLFFCASALSKSAAVTFPVVALLLDRWLSGKWKWADKLPFIVVSAAISSMTIYAQGSGEGDTIATSTVIPILARIGLIGFCSLFYVWKFLWPCNLSAIYPTFDELHWSAGHTIGFALAFLIVTAVVAALRRRAPLLCVAWVFYIVTLTPTIGLLPVGIHVVADRYCYLPFVGLALALSWIIVGVIRWLALRQVILGWMGGILVGAIIIGLSCKTARDTEKWTDTETLFFSVLQANPDHWLAHIKLAAWHRQIGFHTGAFIHSRRAVELEPDAPRSRKSYAWTLLDLEEYRPAIAQLKVLADRGQADADVWLGLAQAFVELGDWPRARAALDKARQFPDADVRRLNELQDRIPRRVTRPEEIGTGS